ncbi:MAG TPA: HNH endonuclease [Candidatus Acidoferrales bacterium]|nr:HNH endonuclease [Candidatus Acidoferrales bacterium]
MDRNAEIRMRVFQYLDQLRDRHGEALAWEDLSHRFEFEGRRVPLLGPQGIFKPAALTDGPLSMTTAPERPGRPRPYEDEVSAGLIHYKYRGEDPQHPDNVGLRRAMSRRIPLVYFAGLVKGRYAAAYPVFVVADDPQRLTFSVQADDARELSASPQMPFDEDTAPARREYITRVTQQRLHQQKFRERVLVAYGQCCAVCRLNHDELLDAAHIIPDHDPRGQPVISNGLALCKIHHAAFDKFFMGIRPDLVVEIRADVLREDDGPMLIHGLKAHHGQRLLKIPSRASERPRGDFLEERYALFRRTI